MWRAFNSQSRLYPLLVFGQFLSVCAMAPKRKSTNGTAALTVVSAITDSDALPSDLRSLLWNALPLALNINKADRHKFEAEVVEQAAEALRVVGKARETAHAEALAQQQIIVSSAERVARDAATKEADAKEKEAQIKVEACDASKKEADKTVHDAENSVKVAQKSESLAEKALQKTTKKKHILEGALTNEFASLTAGATTSEKKTAVRLLLSLGKEYGVGSTLLQAFELACKSEVSSRSEFEATTLATVKAKLDEALQAVIAQLGEEIAAAEQKKIDTTTAKETLVAAQTAQSGASERHLAARDALKCAKKSHTQAIASRHNIWEEMRKLCDAQDLLAKAVNDFKDVITPAFEEAKEKVTPVIEEKPVEEPAEKKQRMDETAPTAN